MACGFISSSPESTVYVFQFRAFSPLVLFLNTTCCLDRPSYIVLIAVFIAVMQGRVHNMLVVLQLYRMLLCPALSGVADKFILGWINCTLTN